MLKQNKDLKSNSSLMERKVDELSDENGVLSSQVMTHVQYFSLLHAISLSSHLWGDWLSMTVVQFVRSRKIQHLQTSPGTESCENAGEYESLNGLSFNIFAGENGLFTAGHLWSRSWQADRRPSICSGGVEKQNRAPTFWT